MKTGVKPNSQYARKGLQPVFEFLEKCHLMFGIGVTSFGKRYAHGQEPIGSKSQIDILHRYETTDHEAGTDEQNQRECNFADHQALP